MRPMAEAMTSPPSHTVYQKRCCAFTGRAIGTVIMANKRMSEKWAERKDSTAETEIVLSWNKYLFINSRLFHNETRCMRLDCSLPTKFFSGILFYGLKF